jgi:hypothetical protein
MKRVHDKKPKKRIVIGLAYETAIKEILMPKTNTNNLSRDWDYTDWVRYCIAEQLKKAGNLPSECKNMLPRFDKDLEI